jgi:PAS domain S-box-containing protein
MPPAVVVLYVGDGARAMDVGQVLDRRYERPVHVVRTTPDEVEALLRDGRPDCVMAGVACAGDDLQTVVDAIVDAGATALPLFDLSGEVAMIPDGIEVHHLDPGTDPMAAAATLVRTLLESSVGPGESTDGGATPDLHHRGLDAYFAVDPDWTVTDWDPRLEALIGVGPGEAVGGSVWDALDGTRAADEGADVDGTVGAAEPASLGDFLRRVAETGEPATAERYRGTTDVWLEVRALPTGTGGVECYARDVSATRELATELEETSERLENTLERITDAFFALDNEERIDFLNSQAEFLLDVDAETVEGERFWDVFPAAVSTPFYQEFTAALETQEPTSFQERYRPLDAWLEVTAYPSDDGLSVFLRDVTDRVELEEKLQALHDVTRRLIVAESDAEIAEDAVAAAVDVLDFPLTVCWRYDRTGEVLDPLAWSDPVADRVDEVRPITAESGIPWEVYEESELRVLDAVPISTPTSHHPGDVDSELLVPLGEYGVLGTYATDADAFDETDVELVRILGTAVESAFARARRERQLARRNERLNDFASVVSHDLRNPLQIADARTEIARETGDLDHLEKVGESLDRMAALIEDLLDRARGDQDLDRATVSLAAVAEEAWDGVDTADATLDVVDDARLSADSGRLQQLLENLFRNAVEHAGEDVAVTVGTHDDGFYVGDDGPGIPADRRESVLEQGVAGDDGGTGYGLAIVADIVEGHGWSIDVTGSEAGGARFEVAHVFSLEPAP